MSSLTIVNNSYFASYVCYKAATVALLRMNSKIKTNICFQVSHKYLAVTVAISSSSNSNYRTTVWKITSKQFGCTQTETQTACGKLTDINYILFSMLIGKIILKLYKKKSLLQKIQTRDFE